MREFISANANIRSIMYTVSRTQFILLAIKVSPQVDFSGVNAFHFNPTFTNPHLFRRNMYFKKLLGVCSCCYFFTWEPRIICICVHSCYIYLSEYTNVCVITTATGDTHWTTIFIWKQWGTRDLNHTHPLILWKVGCAAVDLTSFIDVKLVRELYLNFWSLECRGLRNERNQFKNNVP